MSLRSRLSNFVDRGAKSGGASDDEGDIDERSVSIHRRYQSEPLSKLEFTQISMPSSAMTQQQEQHEQQDSRGARVPLRPRPRNNHLTSNQFNDVLYSQDLGAPTIEDPFDTMKGPKSATNNSTIFRRPPSEAIDIHKSEPGQIQTIHQDFHSSGPSPQTLTPEHNRQTPTSHEISPSALITPSKPVDTSMDSLTAPTPVAGNGTANKKLQAFIVKANAKVKERQEMIDLMAIETVAQEDEIQFLQRQIHEAQQKLQIEQVESRKEVHDLFKNFRIYQHTDEQTFTTNSQNEELICLDATYVSRLQAQVYRTTLTRKRLEKQLLFVKGSCDEIVQSLRDSLHRTEKTAAEEQQSLLSELSTATINKAELEHTSQHRLETVNKLLASLEEDLAHQQALSKTLREQQQSLETSTAHLEMDMMNQLTNLSAHKIAMEEEYQEQMLRKTEILEHMEEQVKTMRYNYRASGLFVPRKKETIPNTLIVGESTILQQTKDVLEEADEDDTSVEDSPSMLKQSNVFRTTRKQSSTILVLEPSTSEDGSFDYYNQQHARIESDNSFRISSPPDMFQDGPLVRDLHTDYMLMRRQDSLWRKTIQDLEKVDRIFHILSMMIKPADLHSLDDNVRVKLLTNVLLQLQMTIHRLKVESEKLDIDLQGTTQDCATMSSSVMELIVSMVQNLHEIEGNQPLQQVLGEILVGLRAKSIIANKSLETL